MLMRHPHFAHNRCLCCQRQQDFLAKDFMKKAKRIHRISPRIHSAEFKSSILKPYEVIYYLAAGMSLCRHKDIFLFLHRNFMTVVIICKEHRMIKEFLISWQSFSPITNAWMKEKVALLSRRQLKNKRNGAVIRGGLFPFCGKEDSHESYFWGV